MKQYTSTQTHFRMSEERTRVRKQEKERDLTPKESERGEKGRGKKLGGKSGETTRSKTRHSSLRLSHNLSSLFWF
jgi:hypothetical protein